MSIKNNTVKWWTLACQTNRVTFDRNFPQTFCHFLFHIECTIISRLVSPMAHISAGVTPLTASSPWLIDRWIRWFADRKRPLHYVLRLIWLLLHVLIEGVCYRGCRSPIRCKCRAVKWMVVQHSKRIFFTFVHFILQFIRSLVLNNSCHRVDPFPHKVVPPPPLPPPTTNFLVFQGSTLDYFPLQFYIEYTDSFYRKTECVFQCYTYLTFLLLSHWI